MRILFVSECYPTREAPQYGIFIQQQAQALEALGNTVDVLIPQRSNRNGDMEKEAAAMKIEYRTIRYELFPVLAAQSVYCQIEQYIQKNDYDLVAVHITSDTVLKMVVKACNRLGIAVVAHYHGLNVWEEFTTRHPLRQKLYAWRRRAILQKIQGAVGVSDKVSDILRQRLKDIPVQTVYNGVDIGKFQRKAHRNEEFHIVGVGNLIEIKGFAYLLDAFAQLHAQQPKTHLDIVGQGVLLPTLQEQAQRLGIADCVTFHGKVPYEQVAEIMGSGDLFVLPSFYEALGCVYLEAMGCGLPTIGVSGMGIDEIISHGENGLLVKPKDSCDLYEKMRQVTLDTELAEKLAENGATTACRYTWDASAKTLNTFYEACVNHEFPVFNG